MSLKKVPCHLRHPDPNVAPSTGKRFLQSTSVCPLMFNVDRKFFPFTQNSGGRGQPLDLTSPSQEIKSSWGRPALAEAFR